MSEACAGPWCWTPPLPGFLASLPVIVSCHRSCLCCCCCYISGSLNSIVCNAAPCCHLYARLHYRSCRARLQQRRRTYHAQRRAELDAGGHRHEGSAEVSSDDEMGDPAGSEAGAGAAAMTAAAAARAVTGVPMGDEIQAALQRELDDCAAAGGASNGDFDVGCDGDDDVDVDEAAFARVLHEMLQQELRQQLAVQSCNQSQQQQQLQLASAAGHASVSPGMSHSSQQAAAAAAAHAYPLAFGASCMPQLDLPCMEGSPYVGSGNSPWLYSSHASASASTNGMHAGLSASHTLNGCGASCSAAQPQARNFYGPAESSAPAAAAAAATGAFPGHQRVASRGIDAMLASSRSLGCFQAPYSLPAWSGGAAAQSSPAGMIMHTSTTTACYTVMQGAMPAEAAAAVAAAAAAAAAGGGGAGGAQPPVPAGVAAAALQPAGPVGPDMTEPAAAAGLHASAEPVYGLAAPAPAAPPALAAAAAAASQPPAGPAAAVAAGLALLQPGGGELQAQDMAPHALHHRLAVLRQRLATANEALEELRDAASMGPGPMEEGHSEASGHARA